MDGTMTTFEAYQEIDALNWSSLKHLMKSPLHYRWNKDHPQPDSDTLIVGRAVHTAILEPLKFLREYAMWSGKVRRGKEWESFQEQHPNKTIIRETDYRRVEQIAAAVQAHPEASRILSGCEYEKSLTWEWLGYQCKGRLDALADDRVVDLKSTADLERFEAQAYRMGYHGQLSWYSNGAFKQDGGNRDVFIVAVESKPPFDVGVYQVSDDAMVAGETLVNGLIERLRKCEAEDKWPGMMPAIQSLNIPTWAQNQAAEMADEELLA